MLIEDEESLRATLSHLSQRAKPRSAQSSLQLGSRDELTHQPVDSTEVLYSKSPTTFAMSMQSLSLTLDAEDMERERNRSEDTQSMKMSKAQQALAIAARNEEISNKKQNNNNSNTSNLTPWSLHNPNIEPMPLSLLLKKSAGSQYKIYLPEGSDRETRFMNIGMDDKLTVKDAIMVILEEHQRLKLSPPLDYRGGKDKYELRLDEGDGEPDYDISIEQNKKLKDLNEGTFCLCDKADFGSDIDDDDDFTQGSKSVFLKPSVMNGGLKRRQSSMKGDLPADTVSVLISNREPVQLPYTEETTLRDLLVPLAEQVKQLRLFSDEYEFTIPADDQRRLSYAFPTLLMGEKISMIGARRFEIRKKIYADSIKLTKLEKLTSGSLNDNSVNNRVGYNEDLAAIYQQWNIIKMNAIGKKQHRVLGIDANKIYNAKPGENPRVTQKGVAKAQREISTVRSVERIDELTFKIVYIEDRKDDVREFNCETSNDCNEIVTKLQYLLKMRKTAKLQSKVSSSGV